MTNLERVKNKYRIVQRGVNSYELQERFLGLFWVDACEYSHFWTKEEALKIIEMWEANAALNGKVVWP
jgi:hypothetical protein